MALGMPLLMGWAMVACNEESDKPLPSYQPDMSVAVNDFSLKADMNVLDDLDSIYFSIDLDKGVIFNADSLPVGTDITKLIPVISYPSTCNSAVIHMEGGKVRQGDVDYMQNPSDSIDFSGKVTFTLTSGQGASSRTYTIKVNVHQLNPDSLSWSNMASAKLPSRLANPLEQKTVACNNMAYTLIKEADNTYTMATTDAPADGSWNKATVSGLSAPDVRSFVAADDAFYILDAGMLMTSANGVNWSATGKQWRSITGGFADCVLGLANVDGVLCHVSYPDKYGTVAAEADFPVDNASNLGLFSSKWSQTPIALLVGGTSEDGTPVRGTWSFDGINWVKISSSDEASAISNASIVPYYIYRKSLTSWRKTEYAIWLLIGGRKNGQDVNDTVWMSYDNGVNWQKAPVGMQLPNDVPALWNADALTIDVQFDAVLSDAWTKAPAQMRLPYVQEGYNLTWRCPYIYMFGGLTEQNAFSNTIWRGVLNQLTFTPII